MFDRLKKKFAKPKPLTVYEAKAMGLHVFEPNYVGRDELMEALKQMEAYQERYKLTGDPKLPELMFELSIKICRLAGVPEDRIIHNEEEANRYFMGDEPNEL